MPTQQKIDTVAEIKEKFSYQAELDAAGIKTLPGNLGEAIDLFAKSETMKEILGDHIHAFYSENKKAEWTDYIKDVSEWELDRYLSVI